MNFKKMALTSVIVLMGVGLTACSNKSSSDHSSKTTQTSKKSNSQSQDKTTSQDKNLRDKFDKIKVGDLMNKGKGGDSENSIKKLFGTPSSTTHSKTNGIKTTDVTWNKNYFMITVSFVDKKAVSKMLTGFKWENRPEKLTLKAYNSLKKGSAYKDVVNKYGEPDNLTEAITMGQKKNIASWTTGVKGGTGANAVLTFINNKLTIKSQSELK